MSQVSREEIYSKIHKALRKSLFELGFNAGRTDFSNPEEVKVLHEELKTMIWKLHSHAEVEEKFLLPVLEAKLPGCTVEDFDAHKAIDRELDRLERTIALFAEGKGMEQEDATYQWYLDLCQFISVYLGHMTVEEEHTARLVQKLLTSKEYEAVNSSIIGSFPPEELAKTLQLMIPSMYHSERVKFLGGIQENAPKPAFEGLLKVIQPVLDSNDYQKLLSNLKVTPEGALV